MPELPEVEIIKRDLERYFGDCPRIERIEFLRPDLRYPLPKSKIAQFSGARVRQITRRAKYLVIETDCGVLLSHLGMTGSWRRSDDESLATHDHIRIRLVDGQKLIYSDPRRFGVFDILGSQWQESKYLKDLGVEPLNEGLNLSDLWQRLRKKQTAIKVALLDQKFIVGIGNIYASEALFSARIKPGRPCRQIKFTEFEVIFKEVRRILLQSIAAGGSTISDFQHGGGQGSYQEAHQVYGREGENCFFCGKAIRQKRIAGRSTYWCPSCQK